MFSLKQPVSSGSSEPIAVSENSKTFDALLRLCYPIDNPVFVDLSQVELVLEAAMKYQLAYAIKLGSDLLRGFIAAEPLRVFVIACRLRLDSEANQAASTWKGSRRFDDSSPTFNNTTAGVCYLTDMSNISAACFYRLLYFCRTNSYSIPSFTSGDPSKDPSRILPEQSSRKSQNAFSENTNLDGLFDGDMADVVLQSTDGVRFRAHTLLFRLSEATKVLDEGAKIVSDVKPPLIQIQLDSGTLADLIRMVVPSSCSDGITDPQRLWRLAHTAIRYGIHRVTTSLK
ncbi:uncharacterized protein PHACADRAFT_177751 [Phanerochaete carnosa HHB-10118-sp]|uniref:BTB domain-containing protein n=1 Tax=Phanerochaete carnosa (strain HHB-10118-sp) TaxID=650164 RepID=K5VWS9_PHACS|nr:uncharacterized protein PHACADRAFT_177751 [Phanerochaete carnosa HHB-10118-sp]EKM51054.1 hypothetical protein PHACADRAFT_177751 [Phanerochaete carnosa HHB-10118-sp]